MRQTLFLLLVLSLAPLNPVATAETQARALSNDMSSEAWGSCQASDQAWVRRAILAISGRKSWGQAEVDAYEDLAKGVIVTTATGTNTEPTLSTTYTLTPGRKLVAEALMAQDDFRLRWSDFVMDALHVVRTEDKSQKDCYGTPSGAPFDQGQLALWVRDHHAADRLPPVPGFKMHELLSSALSLDDLSVVYRAHLFAMVSRPMFGANLDLVSKERARRQDFGGIFDATYLHRNLVCLGCHNSEFSVSLDATPVPGHFERALFGSSDGAHPAGEQTTKGTDFLRAHSMLRYDGVIVNAPDATTPYGWDGKGCGSFGHPNEDPLLDVDTYFGDIRGQGASVWDLEASLHRGVDKLAAHGLRTDATETIADSDEAFAYLVSENIVGEVWEEVMGSALTISNDLPRNTVERDTLRALTRDFAASHFSLKTLLIDVLAHPAFNVLPPSAGCGEGPYAQPNLYNPWSVMNEDPALRGNGGGDGVFALSSRPLVRALHRAMHWPEAPQYPAPSTFQAAVGFFVKDSAPGFRGLDFQGRAMWESIYGSCSPLTPNDFIARIVTMASSMPEATLGDGIVALKDRLLGEPAIDANGEQALLERLVGDTLASVNHDGLEGKLRKVCGMLVSTPQFMLGGTVPEDTRVVPKLTPPEHSYEASCRAMAIALKSRRVALKCGASVQAR